MIVATYNFVHVTEYHFFSLTTYFHYGTITCNRKPYPSGLNGSVHGCSVDFLTWHLVGWRLCCQPIKSQPVRKNKCSAHIVIAVLYFGSSNIWPEITQARYSLKWISRRCTNRQGKDTCGNIPIPVICWNHYRWLIAPRNEGGGVACCLLLGLLSWYTIM